MFAYASGVWPRWMTFLIPRESFGLVLLWRAAMGCIVSLRSVIWLEKYFSDAFAGLIERDQVRHLGPIGHEFIWTMSPFVFAPWLVSVVYQYRAKLNPLVRGPGLIMYALVGGVAVAAVLGISYGFMWSVFYCFRRALDAPALIEKVLWGICRQSG
jgi:hypothetical protein